MRKQALVLAAALAILVSAGCAVHPGTSPAAAGGGSFESHLRQGVSFLSRSEYAKAEAELRRAVALNPGSARARNFLGLCLFQEKDYSAAGGQFEKAVKLDPSLASAYNNLGGVLCLKHEFARAEEMFKKALSLSPDMVSANYGLGFLLASLGKRDEGSRYLAHGIGLDPAYLDTHKESIASFALLSFDRKETLFTYAEAYAAAGDIDRAVEFLEKAKEAGFTDWQRILEDKAFEKARDDGRIRKFLL